MDRDSGLWAFRDQNTDIAIRRVQTQDVKGQPQTYFIAHVWMRNNQFRAGFGHEDRTGRALQKPYRIARRYGAALLITGDTMLNLDESRKSTMIRDGHTYLSKNGRAVLAWNERTLSFEVFPNNSFTPLGLQERGYRDVYCFGPILMQNGELTPNLRDDYLGAENPRTGVGMVEPGHFVLIVADGRQKDYAIGLYLDDFAQLFKDEGCVLAYNLDGGVSAAMVFMGQHLNTHLNIKDYSQQRGLPDALLFGHTTLLPDENDPAPEYDGIRTGADDQLIVAPQNPEY